LGFDRYPFGYYAEDLDEQYMENVKQLLTTGERSQKYLYSYSESGAHTTAAVAIKDSAGEIVGMLCVEKPMSILDSAQKAYLTTVIVIGILVALAAIVLFIFMLRRILIRPLIEITDEAERFAEGGKEPVENLKAAQANNEIGVLATSIQKMELDIKNYIENLTKVTAEKERIGAELNVATQIQADMLPRIFPAFPERDEFDIYATMTPAKEVGGDFYDFFMVDDDHLAMVMADVSGKGVPAALFMVIAKTLIKNLSQSNKNYSPAEVLAEVNNQLCEGNDAELFVTVWLAILEISTGKGMAANAGHEHPAIKRAGGEYELIVYKHSPAVATMEGLPFREHEFEMHKGDSLFVYTDGVTEATNANDELFGNDRLVGALNKNPDADPVELLNNVKDSIDEFVAEAPQFDDITMLCLEYGVDR
ncbi:MAG: SpoIIE family protein phosphatase, partial [Eubacterium sp.]|nr:SpoIIE family protein phosphatase [Eubacterium sp.]